MKTTKTRPPASKLAPPRKDRGQNGPETGHTPGPGRTPIKRPRRFMADDPGLSGYRVYLTDDVDGTSKVCAEFILRPTARDISACLAAAKDLLRGLKRNHPHDVVEIVGLVPKVAYEEVRLII